MIDVFEPAFPGSTTRRNPFVAAIGVYSSVPFCLSEKL